ncbi:MAG: hypothetical protein NVS9B15_23790 [Acidobacteriaceae bacterium]
MQVRNELVFTASHTTANRFNLCNAVFLATRRLHAKNSSIPNSINSAIIFCSRTQLTVATDVPLRPVP